MQSARRGGVVLLLLLLALVGPCCFGPAPAPEDVYSAKSYLELFRPVLMLHVDGKPLELTADQRSELERGLAAWPSAAASMREDGDGFRDAEISTAKVLSPFVRDALDGKPFDSSLRSVVLFKLETWAGRILSPKGQ